MTSWRVKAAAAALALAWSASAASAQEVRLITPTMSAAQSYNTVHIFQPWAKRINEQGKGAVSIDLRDGFTLANFSNVYERVQSDVIQIGWAVHGILAGRFPRTEVASLPFVTESAEEASAALWRLYENGLLGSEYDDIVPLKFGVMPQFQLHFTKPLSAVESLRGLKVSASGRIQNRIVELLGGTPMSIPTQDLYTALQRGTIDGTVISWSAFDTFNLDEVTTFHIEGALGASTTMIFMSKKKHDALPASVRAVLRDHSGMAASRDFGRNQDKKAEQERAKVLQSEKKHTVVELDAQQLKQWNERISPLIADWAENRPNGAALLQAFQAALAEVRGSQAAPAR